MIRAVALLLFLFSPARADERIRPAAVLLAEGYKPAATLSAAGSSALPPGHALPWPVRFQDAEHTLGNVMAQFQPFGSPYYHGGDDLRVDAGADVLSPVDGKLEAGHYSYSAHPDGSLEKFWKPWPEDGDPTYFEVAVVADGGIRYEFHHVNRGTLPPEIVAKLDAGGGRAAKGELLGHAVEFPMAGYNHVHYNIVLPDGRRVNPEFASALLPDKIPPTILHAFAVGSNGDAKDFAGGAVNPPVKEFVLHVVDKQDANVYEHPPAYALLKFDRGGQTLWDFRETLTDAHRAFPPLWDFFAESIRSPSGAFETEGGYGTGASLIRLQVPAGASGGFTLEVGDIAGNVSTMRGELAADRPALAQLSAVAPR
ncbi:MAG: hypothetical protein ACHQ49_04075 [Elusimicrobiota bacterium]